MAPTTTRSASAEVPGMPPLHRQVRWWILGLLFCVTVINFVDRQALSVLAPIIRDTFHLSNTQYGTIVSWFPLFLASLFSFSRPSLLSRFRDERR